MGDLDVTTGWNSSREDVASTNLSLDQATSERLALVERLHAECEKLRSQGGTTTTVGFL